MAGLMGILRLGGGHLDARDVPTLEAMGAALSHRGLAARRTRLDGPLGLVVPAEEQTHSPAGGVVVCIDGRIDALDVAASRRGLEPRRAPEDLVRELWLAEGSRFLDELEGRFALVLWDGARRRLLLARDRLGVRPLFFARLGADALVFASEVKALLAHPRCPREVDWVAALAQAATPRSDHARTSYFLGVEHVDAATAVEIDAASGQVTSRATWHLELREDDEGGEPESTWIERFAGALDRAVDRALGDRPDRAGLLLSGGIDSVSLAALAARRHALPTFTVLAQSTFGNGDARGARVAAEKLGLPNHQVLAPWQPDTIRPDDWRRLLWQTETPDCGAQHWYKASLHAHARAAYPELAVMLNGEGADELFGADFRNQDEEREDASFALYLEDLAEKQREGLHTLDTLSIDAWMGRPVLSRDALAEAAGRAPPHPWRRRTRYCLEGFCDDVLWRDDRLAAAHGMSAAPPFLDAAVVDVIASVPPRLYEALFWEKRVLREAMRAHLPDELRLRPKTPFFAGVDGRYTSKMLYGALVADDLALVREAFGADLEHPKLAPGLVRALLADAERDPERGAASPLLRLVNLGLLEAMARGAARAPAAAPRPTVELGAWDDAKIAELLGTKRAILPLDRPLAFAPGVYLVRLDAHGAVDPPSYLAVGDEVRYVLEGDDMRLWREVLRRVDGRRTLPDILAELGAREHEVRKNVEEALDFEVLAFT